MNNLPIGEILTVWGVAAVVTAAALLAVKLRTGRRATPPSVPLITPVWPPGRAPIEETTVLPVIPREAAQLAPPQPRSGRHRSSGPRPGGSLLLPDPAPYAGFDNPLRTPGGDAQ